MHEHVGYRQYSLRLGLVLLATLLVALQPGGGPGWGKARSAEAAATAGVIQYLPAVANRFPLRTVFGVEMTSIEESAGLGEVAQAGASWIRLNGLRWSDIEPVEGQRNWSAVAGLEQQLLQAAEKNLQVILVVRQAPEWARKFPVASCGPVKESKLGALANFMADLAARYGAPPYHVKYWEIWNEPDVVPELALQISGTDPFGCWGDSSDTYYGGGYYAAMLKAIYPRLKAADPEARVIIGGLLLSCNPATGGCSNAQDVHASKFFEGILANDGGQYFDGVGYHNYDYFVIGKTGAYTSPKWSSAWNTTGPASIAKARFLNELMVDYGVTGKYLINTETALLCGGFADPPGGAGCDASPDSPYELTKAYYVVQSYASAIAEGLRGNVWYHVTGWRNSGLLYDDLSPRPAFTAFQIARNTLNDAAFLGEVTSLDTGGVANVKGYKFRRHNGRQVWVLWSLDGQSHTIRLAEAPREVRDAFGNAPASLADAAELVVTLEPVYVEWNR